MPRISIARVGTLTLLCIAANGAFGEVPTEVIDKAKDRFFEIYYQSESGLIMQKLQHLGLAQNEQVKIATGVTRAIADCIIDGLTEAQSQVAYTYLVLAADDSIDEDVGGRLRDTYPRAEYKEFSNLTAQLMGDCREEAYAVHHLSPD